MSHVTNEFVWSVVLRACEISAKQDGNACVLDISTDGVACDVDNNLNMNLDYLNGDSNTVAMTDNKHITKMPMVKQWPGHHRHHWVVTSWIPGNWSRQGWPESFMLFKIGPQTLLWHGFVLLQPYRNCSVKISKMLVTFLYLLSISLLFVFKTIPSMAGIWIGRIDACISGALCYGLHHSILLIRFDYEGTLLPLHSWLYIMIHIR